MKWTRNTFDWIMRHIIVSSDIRRVRNRSSCEMRVYKSSQFHDDKFVLKMTLLSHFNSLVWVNYWWSSYIHSRLQIKYLMLLDIMLFVIVSQIGENCVQLNDHHHPDIPDWQKTKWQCDFLRKFPTITIFSNIFKVKPLRSFVLYWMRYAIFEVILLAFLN